MLTTIVVNLPVRRLEASADFFNQLGFTVDTALSGASATHIVIGEHVSLMLVAESFFCTITARDVVDPATGAEVVIQLQLDSRAQVDRLVDAALGAGGQVANPPN